MITFGEMKLLEKQADYDRLIREFGATRFSPETLRPLRTKHKLIQMEFFFAHRDFDKYLEVYRSGGQVAIVSGRGPSNYMHLGHLIIFDFIRWLQSELNAEVYIPLSDDEKYVFNKVKTLEEAYIYAVDNAIDIATLGYDSAKTHMYVSSQTKWVYKVSLELSRHLTYSTVKAAFGLTESVNPGVVFYSAVQAAHILMPTIEHGYPVVVPIGMDQDPYMRLTRDVAAKIKMFKPASIYSKYLSGLTGEPMSASRPETCIFMNDSPEIIKKKVWNAFSGGRATIKEQRKLGGEPEKCVVYEWLMVYDFKNVKEATEHKMKCISGELICGVCKERLYEALFKFLREHHKRRRIIKNKIQEYFDHEIQHQ